MEIVQEQRVQSTDDRKEQNSHRTTILNEQLHHPRFQDYGWWFRVCLYITFVMAGQSSATILGRLYYDKGGHSKWIATLVQSSGFPLLLPLYFCFPPNPKFINMQTNDPSETKHIIFTLVPLYIAFGVLMVGDNLMYSYALLYLPVSTYSLLCAVQLAFNALFSFFLNSQKFTALVVNSIVILTISASLLAVNAHVEDPISVPKEKYIIGFLCTLGASAAFSLYLSLVELSFEKVIKRKTFSAILDMQLYPSLIASCCCVVGLFTSGEWKSLASEMNEYHKGKVSYIMTLIWTGLTWQISTIGLTGLVFEVSSLFSNIICTLALPIVPILAIMLFHDKINGVKVIALLLALWGFLSYIYQHYLDNKKSKADNKGGDCVEISRVEVQIC
ncbi:unnamed protein product [Lupinus luteus]|uniref:Probable purine permease n=1 Tax=Lupinus luteus TaxID=3873 RepID=A0AAV1WSG4_LUPLU